LIDHKLEKLINHIFFPRRQMRDDAVGNHFRILVRDQGARSKYPERERKGIGVGVVRTKASRRGLQESVEREAAVATAVPDPQGACYDGQ
jgi:hypothetical protein